jgi:hypothetical protein
MERMKRAVDVVGLQPALKARLDALDILRNSLHLSEAPKDGPSRGPLFAYRVRSPKEGSDVANALAQSVAALVPRPYQHALSDTRSPDHPLVQPLAYIFSELIDNGFSHGRGAGYTHAEVWTSAQYFPTSGLVRLAVGDDGCGFLNTLKERAGVDSHTSAIRMAFRPNVSCKRDVGLFRDAVHQGLGLTICRDIAARAGGHVSVVSGSGWVINPERHGEHVKTCAYWQGSIVSAEILVSGINAFNFRDITKQYTQREDLPIRFV